MQPERFPTDPEASLREEVSTAAKRYRLQLEELEKEARESEGTPEHSEGVVHRIARLTAESYGRAILDTGKHVSRAVELLALADALKKNDIQVQLAKTLERLSQSDKLEDEEELVKASERLLLAR